MTLVTTIISALIVALVLGLSLFLSRRQQPGHLPLVPHGAVQFLALVLLLMLLAHILTLVTGAAWRGRL